MKVFIDVSVFAEGAAVGMVSGELELLHLPRAGERIDFCFPPVSGVSAAIGISHHRQPEVETILHAAGSLAAPIVVLRPIEVESVEVGQGLLEYLSSGFGLAADVFCGSK